MTEVTFDVEALRQPLTTERLRTYYTSTPHAVVNAIRAAEFDRWLAAHDAELIGEMKERNPIPELEG